jgi:hypothetical protein
MLRVAATVVGAVTNSSMPGFRAVGRAVAGVVDVGPGRTDDDVVEEAAVVDHADDIEVAVRQVDVRVAEEEALHKVAGEAEPVEVDVAVGAGARKTVSPMRADSSAVRSSVALTTEKVRGAAWAAAGSATTAMMAVAMRVVRTMHDTRAAAVDIGEAPLLAGLHRRKGPPTDRRTPDAATASGG